MEKQVIFKLKLGTSLQLQFVYKNRKILLEGLFSLFSLGVEKKYDFNLVFCNKTESREFGKGFYKNFDYELFELTDSNDDSYIMLSNKVDDKIYFYKIDETDNYYSQSHSLKIKKSSENNNIYQIEDAKGNITLITKSDTSNNIVLPIETKNDNYCLNFLYDGNNSCKGVELIGANNVSISKYFYVKNSLNDVVEIIDENGLSIGTYIYAAYGEQLIHINNPDINDIMNKNPIRYRGYYYDVETGLFMMGHRYYSPELCRFIQPDDIEYLDPSSINGLNLYCYCMNNPIMYVDPTGNSPDSIWKTLLGVVVGIGLAVVTVAAVVASGGTLLAPVLVGAGIGAGLNLVGQGVSNLSEGKGFFEDINWGNVALGGLSGAAFATGVGGLWGAVAIGATSNAGMSALEGNSWANIGFSALVGGASAFAGFKLGKFVSNRLLNINTNLGIGDYVNMARVDGAGFWTRNGVALLSKLYTMGPTFATGVSRGATKAIGNWIGGWF